MFSVKQFKRSFSYAIRGIRYVFRNEQSFRIQIIAAVLVFLLAGYLRILKSELILLILVVTSVLVLELFNSVIEQMVDLLKPRLHHQVKTVKNMMAGAVLVASLGALIVGVLIFTPYIVAFF